MARQKANDSLIYHVFRLLPWWGSLATIAGVFTVLRFIVPASTGKSLALLSYSFAPWLTLVLVLFALWAERDKHLRRKLLDQQSSLETIRGMSWQHFEQLVGEAYRRQGYKIEETGGGGADGGVDLILRRSGETVLVQCKRWKQAKVGAPTVRELRGAVARDGATRGIFVTSGTFTREAIAEAQGQPPLELVDGTALLALVQEVKGQKISQPEMPSMPDISSALDSKPSCPLCHGEMKRRTAKQGHTSDSQFWGCLSFPRCRGTRQV